MSTLSKQIIAVLLLLILSTHFVFIFINTFPFSIKNKLINNISQVYTYPYFYQQWNLFVPTPKNKNKVYIKLYSKNKMNDWQLIFPVKYTKPNYNICFGGDVINLLFSNITTYQLNSLSSKSSVFYNEQQNIEFKILNKAILHYIKKQHSVDSLLHYDMLILNKTETETRTYLFKNLAIK